MRETGSVASEFRGRKNNCYGIIIKKNLALYIIHITIYNNSS